LTSASRDLRRLPGRRPLLFGLAGAAVLAAVLIIVLSGSRGTPGDHRGGAGGTRSPVRVAARYLGLTAAELRARLHAGETLAEIVAARKGATRAGLIGALFAARSKAIERRHLPAATERAELAALRRALSRQVDQPRGRRQVAIQASARYLGIGEDQLRHRLAGGQTLADLAASTPGRSRVGLLAALSDVRRRAIERALREKAITPAGAQRAIARARARASREANRPGG